MGIIDYDQDTNTLYAIVIGSVLLILLCLACIVYGIIRSGVDCCMCIKSVVMFPCRVAEEMSRCCFPTESL